MEVGACTDLVSHAQGREAAPSNWPGTVNVGLRGGVHEDSFEFSFQYRCFSLLYSHSTFQGHSSMWESLICYSEGSPVFGI